MPLKNEDIEQLIAILQKGLTNSEESSKEESIKPIVQKKQQKTNKKNNNKSEFVNKFDQMMEKDMHKSDSRIDQLLSVHPPTTRSREFEPVRAQCRVCQKIEDVNPNLVFDSPGRYKCNKCSGAPG